MKLTITIQMDNAAFEKESGTEVARILQDLGSNYEFRDLLPGETISLRDVNGNKVGKAKVTA